MADDKRDGDDLFEDLDKFFAPIKDVDWDEPASAGAQETPSEEHVAVRAGDPAPTDPAPDVEPEVAAPVVSDVVVDDGDDEDWYDTTVLDTIEGIAVGDEPAPTTDSDIVSLDDLAVGDAPMTDQEDALSHDPAQAGLFAGDENLGTETAPMSTIDDIVEEEVIMTTAPSDEDLEAAAEHFASPTPDDAEVTVDDDAVVGGVVGFEDEVEVVEPAAYAGADDILAGLHPDEEPQTVTVASTEGLGGPSWQGSAAVEVGADIDRRGPSSGERDVPAAFLTGVVMAGVALAALLIGKGVFGVIAAIVVLLAQGELFGVMVKHHRQPATAVGLVAGALMLAGGYFKGEGAVLAMFSLGVIATFLWFMAGPANTRKDTAINIGLTILNLAWIPLLGSYLFIMLKEPDGTQLVVAVIALTFVYDTAAFLSGSVWGGQFFQRPLAPSVSPKKSVEGLVIGGLITVIVSVALVSQFVDPLQDKRIEALLLGIVVAGAATFGDLAESLIKRDVGIKDMSSLLPGHGGVLDRIDSLLFVAPAAFLLFRVVFA
ncbi:MAG TPA: phosphatidate cytidylyltransferase [Actinomycetota bacterium]